MIMDCEKHGKNYDRDWCPFCELENERRYKENCIKTIDETLKPHILELEERLRSLAADAHI